MADDNTTNTTSETENTTPADSSADVTTPATDTEATEDEEVLITLTVEDGTCVASANSYISYEDALAYMKQHNRTEWTALTENEQKASLIKAVQYIDAQFPWKGTRKYETQTLAFPRKPRYPSTHLWDNDGFEYTGKIPQRLKDAVCEAAYYGYKSELFTVYSSESGVVKRDKKRVEGAVETEVEYFSNDETEVNYITKYAALDSLLKGLYIPKDNGSVNCHVHWNY